jgi:hypothetical protein
MKIEITHGGVYGADGKEIEIGTEFEVESEPTGLAGRYRVINEKDTKAKTPVTNPKKDD